MVFGRVLSRISVHFQSSPAPSGPNIDNADTSRGPSGSGHVLSKRVPYWWVSTTWLVRLWRECHFKCLKQHRGPFGKGPCTQICVYMPRAIKKQRLFVSRDLPCCCSKVRGSFQRVRNPGTIRVLIVTQFTRQDRARDKVEASLSAGHSCTPIRLSTSSNVMEQPMLSVGRHEGSTQKATPNVLPCRVHHDGPIGAADAYWTPTQEPGRSINHSLFQGYLLTIPRRKQSRIFQRTEAPWEGTENPRRLPRCRRREERRPETSSITARCTRSYRC